MAEHAMRLSKVVWDDAANTATLTFEELISIPGPGSENSNWYPDAGTTVTVMVPIRKATVTNATGRSLTQDPATGDLIWTKYELINGAWVSLGRVNADGTPYVG